MDSSISPVFDWFMLERVELGFLESFSNSGDRYRFLFSPFLSLGERSQEGPLAGGSAGESGVGRGPF